MYYTNQEPDPTVVETRKFATLNLLRKVNESVTDDVVVSYIDRKMSGCCTYDVMTKGAQYGTVPFPDGIRKMTKDYLTRMFWKNLRNITFRSLEGVNCLWSSNKIRTVRKFPKKILHALDTVHIHSTSRLWDVKNAIDTLYSVVVPKDVDGATYKDYFRSRAGIGTDILSPKHIRVICALKSVLSNYMYANFDRSIPNDAEKTLALDLLETLSILSDEVGFFSAYRARAAYAYAVTKNHDYCNRYLDGIVSHMMKVTYYGLSHDVDQREEYAADVALLSHLSPNAAICNKILTVRGSVDRPYFTESDIDIEFLKKITPVPIPEVVVYLWTEINMQLRKLEIAKSVYRDFKNGKDVGGLIFYGNDPCCEAEIGCCCNKGSMVA